MAISGTKGQGLRAIPSTQYRKASDTFTSTLATFLFSSHPKRERGREAHLNYYTSNDNRERTSQHKTKINQLLALFARAMITLPRFAKLLLMFCVSLRRCPCEPDSFSRSLPAKSIRFSIPTPQHLMLSYTYTRQHGRGSCLVPPGT